MIERYTRPCMGAIWSEAHKLATWWRVEREVCRVQAARGLIPPEALEAIEMRAAFDPARIRTIESEVRHDVIAFLTNLAETIGPEARYIHQGMTSSDLLDTALALQLAEAGELLCAGLADLIEVLNRQALAHRDTLMIGRTHGVHAEPVTFGLKLLIWRNEMQRHQTRLALALEQVRVGKLSGAVGTYQHLDPQVEAQVCGQLGLTAAPVSNQIIQRDRHAFLVSVMALIGASIEKIAVEIRHLQRTEVREVEEPFTAGQKGSSAMPHKRNPILSERLCGQARLMRSYAQVALEDVALWHERDISHSSAERVILPDACCLLDFMLADLTYILQHLVVYPERMRANLQQAHGVIFSQAVLLALVARGLAREAAYAIVQRCAMTSWQSGADFCSLLQEEAALQPYMNAAEIAALFSFEQILNRINRIFERQFEQGKNVTTHPLI